MNKYISHIVISIFYQIDTILSMIRTNFTLPNSIEVFTSHNLHIALNSPLPPQRSGKHALMLVPFYLQTGLKKQLMPVKRSNFLAVYLFYILIIITLFLFIITCPENLKKFFESSLFERPPCSLKRGRLFVDGKCSTRKEGIKAL